jgi:hypothetical protein
LIAAYTHVHLLRYVFEDGIDFVKSSVIEGTQHEEDSDQEDIDEKDMLKRELQVCATRFISDNAKYSL